MAGRGDPLRFALDKAGGGQGGGGEEISGGRAAIPPAAEQIHLLLDREQGADLFEEGAEFLRWEGEISLPLQPAPPLHQLLQQLQPLAALSGAGQVAVEQVEHPVGGEPLELAGHALAQVGTLSHALQQL